VGLPASSSTTDPIPCAFIVLTAPDSRALWSSATTGCFISVLTCAGASAPARSQLHSMPTSLLPRITGS
jgi:hypothetical protein